MIDEERIRVAVRPAINFFFTLPRFGTGGKMVVVGVAIVVFLVVMTLLAPFIAPHNPTAAERWSG